MIGEDWPVVSPLLGLGEETLAIWHMGARAVLVYLVAIVLVRMGEKRFLGKYTALDVILGFMLGSILSRAVTGSSAFFETLGAALVLVAIHWLFAAIAFRSDRFGDIVKGQERVLIRDGEILWDAMKTSHISKNDLLGALRSTARIEKPEEVKVAHLERSGEISVIKNDSKPEVVDVKVEDGVQTVRIEMK